MGSITKVKPDRLAMQDVVEHQEWAYPIKWLVFNKMMGVSENADEYQSVMKASSFTLCPVGTADDNYRFWEAIEAGSIPIYVPRNVSLISETSALSTRGERDCPGSFDDVWSTNPPIVQLLSWASLPAFLDSMTEDKIARMRENLVMWNHMFWRNTTRRLDEAITRGLQQFSTHRK